LDRSERLLGFLEETIVYFVSQIEGGVSTNFKPSNQYRSGIFFPVFLHKSSLLDFFGGGKKESPNSQADHATKKGLCATKSEVMMKRGCQWLSGQMSIIYPGLIGRCTMPIPLQVAPTQDYVSLCLNFELAVKASD
jgi:hypothetical protein